jgi:hypothetical protein
MKIPQHLMDFLNDERGILFDYVAGLVLIVVMAIIYFLFYDLVVTTLPGVATNVSNDNALITGDLADTAAIRIVITGFKTFPWIVAAGVFIYYFMRSQRTEFDTGGFGRL